MGTRKLKYFLAAVDHTGFNRAAEHLLIAQPSLSQTITSLKRNSASRCSTGSAAAQCSAGG